MNIKQVNEISKFLEISTFSEFKNIIIPQINSISKRNDELGRLIEDILMSLEMKVNIKDLKSLEDGVKIRIEDIKSSFIKRFADKLDTNKQFKFIENQIKGILDSNKGKEKGENWLLAKKPVNGYSCASCEAYIGDLHETNQPIYWNRYPNRDLTTDQINKPYRVRIFLKID